MCFGLSTSVVSSLEKNEFSSLSRYQLPTAALLGVGPCEISPIHVGMSTRVIAFQVLFRQPYYLWSHLILGRFLIMKWILQFVFNIFRFSVSLCLVVCVVLSFSFFYVTVLCLFMWYYLCGIGYMSPFQSNF